MPVTSAGLGPAEDLRAGRVSAASARRRRRPTAMQPCGRRSTGSAPCRAPAGCSAASSRFGAGARRSRGRRCGGRSRPRAPRRGALLLRRRASKASRARYRRYAPHGRHVAPALDSPRAAERQTDPDHRRSRFHRDDACAPARRRQRRRRVRQPPPRRALRHGRSTSTRTSRFVAGDVLDAGADRGCARGDAHRPCRRIAGVDTVLESPVRTMRVNLIGTYNALEAALATKDTLERLIEFSTSEVFGQHAFNVAEGHVTAIGSVGEARWTYAVSKLAGEHMAHAYHDELGLPTVSVRPFNIYGPGQIGGGAIRAFIEAALDGRDLTIHGDGSQIRAWTYVDDMVDGPPARRSSTRGGRRELQHRQRPLGRDDLRPGDADQAADRRARARSSSSRSTTPTSSSGSRTSRRRGSCSASRPTSSSTTGSSGRSRGTARSSPHPRDRPDPPRAPGRRRGRARGHRGGPRDGQLTMGAKVREFEASARERVRRRRMRSPSRPARLRSISR